MRKGASTSLTDKQGWNPLHNLASQGSVEGIKILVEEYDTSLNSKNNDGFTALMCASSKGFEHVAGYLVSKGADPCIRNRFGETAYDLAGTFFNLFHLRPLYKIL